MSGHPSRSFLEPSSDPRWCSAAKRTIRVSVAFASARGTIETLEGPVETGVPLGVVTSGWAALRAQRGGWIVARGAGDVQV
ncbi:MAG: hypothetical protein ACRDXC_10035, partial [Acidimicrobiales bacterium]